MHNGSQPCGLESELFVVAVRDHVPASALCSLPLLRGDIARVLERSHPSVWLGELNGRVGTFPTHCVRIVVEGGSGGAVFSTRPVAPADVSLPCGKTAFDAPAGVQERVPARGGARALREAPSSASLAQQRAAARSTLLARRLSRQMSEFRRMPSHAEPRPPRRRPSIPRALDRPAAPRPTAMRLSARDVMLHGLPTASFPSPPLSTRLPAPDLFPPSVASLTCIPAQHARPPPRSAPALLLAHSPASGIVLLTPGDAFQQAFVLPSPSAVQELPAPDAKHVPHTPLPTDGQAQPDPLPPAEPMVASPGRRELAKLCRSVATQLARDVAPVHRSMGDASSPPRVSSPRARAGLRAVRAAVRLRAHAGRTMTQVEPGAPKRTAQLVGAVVRIQRMFRAHRVRMAARVRDCLRRLTASHLPDGGACGSGSGCGWRWASES